MPKVTYLEYFGLVTVQIFLLMIGITVISISAFLFSDVRSPYFLQAFVGAMIIVCITPYWLGPLIDKHYAGLKQLPYVPRKEHMMQIRASSGFWKTFLLWQTPYTFMTVIIHYTLFSLILSVKELDYSYAYIMATICSTIEAWEGHMARQKLRDQTIV